MTREEARQLLPVIQALAEGKTIQFQRDSNVWVDMDNPTFNMAPSDYRIKPEPNYRPFKNQEECWQEMLKHQPFGWVKNEYSNIFNIIDICKDTIKINEHGISYFEFCERFKFIDGTSCGRKEIGNSVE